jgi:hypothetical protein
MIRCSSGRAVKQRVSVWESEDDLDEVLDPPVNPVPAPTGVAKGMDPAPTPKTSRRAHYEFPDNLRAPKTDRPRFVKMALPEQLIGPKNILCACTCP